MPRRRDRGGPLPCGAGDADQHDGDDDDGSTMPGPERRACRDSRADTGIRSGGDRCAGHTRRPRAISGTPARLVTGQARQESSGSARASELLPRPPPAAPRPAHPRPVHPGPATSSRSAQSSCAPGARRCSSSPARSIGDAETADGGHSDAGRRQDFAHRAGTPGGRRWRGDRIAPAKPFALSRAPIAATATADRRARPASRR